MKIPTTFLPERKNLEEKTLELSVNNYEKKLNLEERAMLKEDYHTELNEKRKKWGVGDHLNIPGTDKISPKRLIFNTVMMGVSAVGVLYLCKEISDYVPNYIIIPSFFMSIVGFPMATYKTIAEVMIRYDTWKKYKGKR